jgi:hypothetical protein
LFALKRIFAAQNPLAVSSINTLHLTYEKTSASRDDTPNGTNFPAENFAMVHSILQEAAMARVK